MTAARVAEIRSRLEKALQPDSLEIVDNSQRHAGHPGARDGRGHFHIRIRSERFAGKTTLERHRMIYAALGSLMQTDIHALGVEAVAPEKTSSSKAPS